MKSLIILFILFSQTALFAAKKITVNGMIGRSTTFNSLNVSTFKNGKPEEDTDKISTAVTFLITNEGTFISHNNGLKKLISVNLGSKSIMHMEHYEKGGSTHNWTFHFSEKNPSDYNQFLVTMTRTRNSLFVTQTGMYWGWANIESLE